MQKTLKLTDIQENKAALRAVDKSSEKFAELVVSVRERGVINPIVVREHEEDGETVHTLVDGLHRFTAAGQAGLEEIPCNIVEADSEEALELQMIGNLHRIETKPVEYSKALKRIMAQNPTLTLVDMAGKVHKSTTWVSQRLNLLKLNETIQGAVDSGDINVSNAYALSTLPDEEQQAFLERAITMNPAEFHAVVVERKKEIQKANREGRKPSNEFTPTSHVRKVKQLKEEFENGSFGKALCEEYCPGQAEGFALGVKWALHQDPVSVAEQKADWEERQAKMAEQKEAKALERKKLKQKEGDVRARRMDVEIHAQENGTDPAPALAEFDKENKIEVNPETHKITFLED